MILQKIETETKGIEDPEISPHSYSNKYFGRTNVPETHIGENSSSNKWFWEN
jgi:hypothetical protein